MSAEQLAALVAAVPSVAALVWVIVRQQAQLDKLIDQLVANNRLLLDLHPPQSKEGAANKILNPTRSEKSDE